MYTTFRGSVVEFIRVSAGMLSVPVKVVTPVIPVGTKTVQANVTPVVGLVKLTAVVVSPVAITWSASEKLTNGDGFTVIEKVSVVPVQLTPLFS